MTNNKFKPGCSKEQKEIINEYFSGVTFKELVKKYSQSHTIMSEITKKEIQMPTNEAELKIYEALSFIVW